MSKLKSNPKTPQSPSATRKTKTTNSKLARSKKFHQKTTIPKIKGFKNPFYKKPKTPLQYASSHWLIFFLQGLIELSLGAFILFGGVFDSKELVSVVAFSLICISATEFFNLLHRRIFSYDTSFILIIIFTQLIVARTLLSNLNQHFIFHLTLISSYAILRGFIDIIIAFRSLRDHADRFIWIICGIVGIVFGFAILNSGHLAVQNTFIHFFGAYMTIFGIGNLIYSSNLFRRSLKK